MAETAIAWVIRSDIKPTLMFCVAGEVLSDVDFAKQVTQLFEAGDDWRDVVA